MDDITLKKFFEERFEGLSVVKIKYENDKIIIYLTPKNYPRIIDVKIGFNDERENK
jgi:hypothetical protein